MVLPRRNIQGTSSKQHHFFGAKPAQKSADILVKTPQHLRMALRSFALSLFTAQHILIYKCVLLNILYISHSLIILQFNFQNGLFTLINRTKGSFANLHLINITAVFFVWSCVFLFYLCLQRIIFSFISVIDIRSIKPLYKFSVILQTCCSNWN